MSLLALCSTPFYNWLNPTGLYRPAQLPSSPPRLPWLQLLVGCPTPVLLLNGLQILATVWLSWRGKESGAYWRLNQCVLNESLNAIIKILQIGQIRKAVWWISRRGAMFNKWKPSADLLQREKVFRDYFHWAVVSNTVIYLERWSINWKLYIHYFC